MIKLQALIESNRQDSSDKIKYKTEFSYAHIGKLINKPYQTVVSKCNNGTFTLHEALYLFQELFPDDMKALENNKQFQSFVNLFVEG